MEKEQEYFREALSNFLSEVAYAGAVKHLHELGYSVEEIQKNVSFPVSKEQILRVIEAEEEKKSHPENAYEFVQDTNAYGKKSYRMVPKQESSSRNKVE